MPRKGSFQTKKNVVPMERKGATCFYDQQRVEEINKKFAQTVAHKYRMYCKREGETFTSSGFVMYLLEKTLIRERTASKYMIVELYPKAMYEEENKNKAVARISNETGYSDRHIRSILKSSPFYDAHRNKW